MILIESFKRTGHRAGISDIQKNTFYNFILIHLFVLYLYFIRL